MECVWDRAGPRHLLPERLNDVAAPQLWTSTHSEFCCGYSSLTLQFHSSKVGEPMGWRGRPSTSSTGWRKQQALWEVKGARPEVRMLPWPEASHPQLGPSLTFTQPLTPCIIYQGCRSSGYRAATATWSTCLPLCATTLPRQDRNYSTRRLEPLEFSGSGDRLSRF